MNRLKACRELLKTIEVFERAADGDSNDAEHDAANEMKEAAVQLIRSVAGHDTEIAGLLKKADL
jgi:hypothetical protein